MTSYDAHAKELIRRQRRRRERSAFASLISNPSAAAITLPQGARLAIRNAALLSASTVALTIGSRTISAPASAAGSTHVVDWLPAGAVVNISAGFTLLLDNGLGVWAPIGSKT